MGAGHSQTRRVTFNNEDKSGVIKVSDSVVQRLKSGPSPEVDENPTIAPPSKPQNIKPPQICDGDDNESLEPYTTPSLTSLQVLQQKDEELRKNDQYWEQRLVKLQETHCKIDKVLEEEFIKASREVAKKFASTGKTNSDPPCQDLKCQVMQCYSCNPHSALACSKAVSAFTACVNTSRLQGMDNKC